MESQLTLILNISFLICLGLGALWGLMKGYKKGLYWFVVMAGYYLFFFLTINQVTSFLWSFKLPIISKIASNIDSQFQDINSFKDAFTLLVQRTFEESMSEPVTITSELMLLFEGLALLVFKIVYTVCYFTVFLIMYKLFFGLIRIIFVRYRRDEPRLRTIGAMFGIGQTFLGIIVSLILFSGIISLVEQATTLVASFDDEMIEIEDFKLVTDSINAYNKSYPVRLANLVKVKDPKSNSKIPATIHVFDSTFSFKYRKEKISLRKELNIYGDVLQVYLNSQFYETNKFSDLQSTEFEAMVSQIKRSELIPILMPIGIELAFELMEEELPISRDELYRLDWKQELNTIGDVAILSFELIELAGLNDNTNLEEVTVDGNQVQLIFNSLAESQVIQKGTALIVTPLLKKVDDQIQAIITIPENVKMEEEIKAIGSIAKEVFDTKLTVGDLRSGDVTRILNALYDEETNKGFHLTVLLESRIITEALINILSNKAGIDDFSVIVVPENIDWYDAYSTDGNLVHQGELRRILVALETMVPHVDSLDFSQFDLGIIGQFNETIIDRLFESRILTATVSTLLTDMQLGDVSLVLADEIYDDERYITKEELKNLSHSALRIYNELACEECPDKIDLDQIFMIDEDSIQVILNSKIISHTIGKLIIDRATDQIVIPTTATVTITIGDEASVVVDQQEIQNIILAGQTFGFDSLDKIDVQVSFIKNLAQKEDLKVLDQQKANRILGSEIIHATISNMLVEADEANEDIVIPLVNSNDEEVLLTDGDIQYVSKAELKAMMQAIIQLDFEDFEQLTSISLNQAVDWMDDLLASAIIHASISRQMLDLQSSHVHIPQYRSDGSPFAIKSIDGTHYVVKDEIISLANAFKVLNFEKVNDFNDSIDLSHIYDEGNQDIILSSSLIHYHLSKQIMEDYHANYIIPTLDYEEQSILLQHDTDRYVHKGEIKAIIGALEVLGITDVKSFNNTFNLTLLTDSVNQKKLLDSAIIHATLSKKLLDLGSDVIIVPEFKEGSNTELDTNRIKKTVDGVTYISASEIQVLIDSFLAMGYSDLESFEVQPVTSQRFFNARETLMKSSTIQATISNRLLNSANIYIPDAVRHVMADVTYVMREELDALLDGLEELGLTDFDAFNFGAANILNFDIASMLDSQTIRATISIEILKVANDENAPINSFVIIVPTSLREDITVDHVSYKQIEKDELTHLLNGLRTIGISDYGTDLNPSKLNEFDEATIDDLLKSGSIHVTISHMIESNAFIVIPEQVQDTLYGITPVITLEEVKYFILAVQAMDNSGDITSIQFNFVAIAQIDADDRDVILTSMIVRANISEPIYHFVNGIDPEYFKPADFEVEIPRILKKDALVRLYNDGTINWS